MARTGEIRIGVSGWTYTPWRGVFYPPGLPHRKELAHASSAFNALEVNGTFYGMQVPANFLRWARETPEGFVFAVKGPRFITHLLRLREPRTALANFFASGPLALGEKLGPMLWQFPPNFRFEPESLERFLAMLPRDTAEAAALGAAHDHRLRAPAHLEHTARPLRHAMEIRHESFRSPAFIALLRRYRVALVCADTVDWPRWMDLTADFVYCRLHGSTELYRSGYSDADLHRWGDRISAWAEGRAMTDGEFVTPVVDDGLPREVYMFFDNTDKLHAPDNARDLMRKLGVVPAGRALTPAD